MSVVRISPVRAAVDEYSAKARATVRKAIDCRKVFHIGRCLSLASGLEKSFQDMVSGGDGSLLEDAVEDGLRVRPRL